MSVRHHDGRYAASVFKDITPAWNNKNLRELCRSIESSCFFAHVRAASNRPGGAVVNGQNCHPFRVGSILFQHNGRVHGFSFMRQRLLAEVRPDCFEIIGGTTDSEVCFALILSLLEPEKIREGSVTPKDMKAAVIATINLIRHFLEETVGLRFPDENYSTLNFAITDGRTVVVTRYCDQAPNVLPPSLFYACGPTRTSPKSVGVPLVGVPLSTDGYCTSSSSDSEADELVAKPKGNVSPPAPSPPTCDITGSCVAADHSTVSLPDVTDKPLDISDASGVTQEASVVSLPEVTVKKMPTLSLPPLPLPKKDPSPPNRRLIPQTFSDDAFEQHVTHAAGSFVCSSEPLTHHDHTWKPVDPQTMLCYTTDNDSLRATKLRNDPINKAFAKSFLETFRDKRDMIKYDITTHLMDA